MVTCVCSCLARLRDLSAQDKVEYQRTMKDLEKSSAELSHAREQKDKLTQELQVCLYPSTQAHQEKHPPSPHPWS